MSGLNFNLSENPSHYTMIFGLFAIIVGTGVLVLREIKNIHIDIIDWGISIVLISLGMFMFSRAHTDLEKNFKKRMKLNEIELEIKKEELRLLKAK